MSRAILDMIEFRPKICVWEITLKCNFQCIHCASDAGGGRIRERELDTGEAIDLCSQLAGLGCEQVTLSGGEPFLRDDWDVIAAKLTELGIRVFIISNGYVFNQQLAQRAKAANVERVAFSFDGLEQTHNMIRGNDGSYQRVMNGFRILAENGIRANAITQINKLNLGELAAMQEILASEQIEFWRLQICVPLGRMRRHYGFVIEPSELEQVAAFVVQAKRRKGPTIVVGDNIGYYTKWEKELRYLKGKREIDFWVGCAAGCLSVGIESNGNVKGCLSLQADEFIEGNIRKESLADIWNKEGNFSYTRDFQREKLSGFCAKCDFGEICRAGCNFLAYASTGSPFDNLYCLYRVQNELQERVSDS